MFLSPTPFSANLPWERVGRGSGSLSFSLSLFLYLSIYLSLPINHLSSSTFPFLFLFIHSQLLDSLPSKTFYPKQLRQSFTTIWLWLSASCEFYTNTCKLDPLLSKGSCFVLFLSWPTICVWFFYCCIKRPPPNLLPNVTKTLIIFFMVGCAEPGGFSAPHGVSWCDSHRGAGLRCPRRCARKVGSWCCSLLWAELDKPSSPARGLSTCLGFSQHENWVPRGSIPSTWKWKL